MQIVRYCPVLGISISEISVTQYKYNKIAFVVLKGLKKITFKKKKKKTTSLNINTVPTYLDNPHASVSPVLWITQSDGTLIMERDVAVEYFKCKAASTTNKIPLH